MSLKHFTVYLVLIEIYFKCTFTLKRHTIMFHQNGTVIKCALLIGRQRQTSDTVLQLGYRMRREIYKNNSQENIPISDRHSLINSSLSSLSSSCTAMFPAPDQRQHAGHIAATSTVECNDKYAVKKS